MDDRSRRSRFFSHLQAAVILLVCQLLLHWRVLLARGEAQRWIWEDFITYSYPTRTLAAAEMARGAFPLWNPYTFAGMPFLADIGAGLLYPPNLLMALFVGDGPFSLSFRALEWQCVLHVWLAGLGTYLFARRLTRSHWGGILAGLVFSLSGFMTMQTIHLGVVQAAAWLPFILLSAWEAQTRRSLPWAAATGALLTLSFLAGHPQTTLFTVMAVGMVTLYRVLWPADGDSEFARQGVDWRQRIAPFLLLAVIGIVALGLAAPQLLPTNEMLDLTIRQEKSYEASAEGSFDPPRFLTFILPHFFGKAHGAVWPTLWGPGRYFFLWELAGYVGLLPLLLAFMGVFSRGRGVYRREAVFLAVLALFGLVLALGKNGFLHPLFYHLLPVYPRLRIPARALMLFDFGVALLAAYGLTRLTSRGDEERRPSLGRWLVALAAVVGTALAVGGIILALAPADGLWHPGEEGKRIAVNSFLELAVAAALAAALLLIVRKRLLSFRWVGALVSLVVVVDLMLFGWGYSAGRASPREFYVSDRGEFIDSLRREGQRELFRVNSRLLDKADKLFLRRNQGPVLGIYTIEGYNQLKLAAFENFQVPVPLRMALLNVKYEARLQGDRYMTLVPNRAYYPRLFFVPRARWAGDEEEALALLRRPDFQPWEEVILLGDSTAVAPPADPSGPSAAAAPSPAEGGEAAPPGTSAEETPAAEGVPEVRIVITSYETDRISFEIESPDPGYVVLSEIYYPGWRAGVDGREVPLLRADYCLRALPVASGTHRVEVYLESRAFRRGILVMSVTLVLCALAVWRGRGKVIFASRPKPDESPSGGAGSGRVGGLGAEGGRVGEEMPGGSE